MKDTSTVLKPQKGQQYHVTWLRKEYVWQCIEVNEEKKTVTLSTKDRKKRIENVLWDSLRHTNKNQQLNPH